MRTLSVRRVRKSFSCIRGACLVNALRRSPHRGMRIWDAGTEMVNNITLLTEFRLLLHKSSRNRFCAVLSVFVIGIFCLILLHACV